MVEIHPNPELGTPVLKSTIVPDLTHVYTLPINHLSLGIPIYE
jgi:hypothetical protein